MKKKERLVAFCRRRLTKQIKNRVAHEWISCCLGNFRSSRSYIGFARRFATYKRATLIFRDVQRLEEIVSDKDHPVQFIISVKPIQRMKKEKIIQEIFQFAKEERFRRELYLLKIMTWTLQGICRRMRCLVEYS